MDVPATLHKWLTELADRPRWAALALAALCLVVYLPGIVRLPAVDRTEVIYAESTRDMVARGNWFDPRFDGQVQAYRPIGTFWAQALTSRIAGGAHARDITIYRLPSLIAVTLSVLALYWLATPLIGATGALIASALFAVAPLTVLVGTLGIAEGLSLLPATIAMLCLARIYTAERDDDTLRLAMLFWTALGAGMLVNALLVQILVIVTLIALRFMDRDLSWLKRLLAAKGVPVALLIAAPWLIVRVLQDGIPYSGLGWQRLIEALGGAQDMKLRAMPGTFILALVLGFLPGTALIVPAISRLWSQRTDKLARFLIAWVLGYLVYLEALSSKPGTYMVQVMFPALAIAVAMLVVRKEESPAVSRGVLIPWPPLAALFPLLPLAAIYYVMRETPSLPAIILAALVAALFWLSAREGRRGEWKNWAVSGVAALGLFAITLLGVVLPGIDKLWPARDIQRAIANCPASSLGILGYNEPSTRFVLNRNAGLSTGYSLARYADGKSDGLAVIAQSWSEQNPSALNAEQKAKLRPFACVNAINTMRGCALALTIVENAARPPCTPPSAYACSKPFTMNATAATRLKPCD